MKRCPESRKGWRKHTRQQLFIAMTVSRDGTKLYLVRGNRTDEVVLIRNID